MSEWKTAAGPMVATGEETTVGTPVTAVIATLADVDKDGDTYAAGAFGYSGTQLISQWDHNTVMGVALPVGSGVIVEEDGLAVFKGLLWTEMHAARDVAAMLRRRGDRQEWSYAFDTLDAGPVYRAAREVRELRAVDAFEVSPVRRGAGMGTRTVGVGPVQEKARRVLAAARTHAADRHAHDELTRAHLRLVALDLADTRR